MKFLRLLLLIVFAGVVLTGCEDSATTEEAKDDSGTGGTQTPNGLVAWFKMDGNAKEAVSNTEAAQKFGTPTANKDRFGTDGGATQFNGTTDYFSVPSSTALESPDTNLTIALWMYVDGLAGSTWASPLAKSTTSAEAYYRVGLGSGQSYSVFKSRLSSAFFTWNQKEWLHLATTWAGDSVKIYLNGQLKSAVKSFVTGTPVNKTSNLEIGRDTPYATEYYKGSLDDIRIYNRALSASEIKALADDK